jgi:aminoglycoside phosphotransferase
MLEATSRESVGAFVGQVLDGSGWQVEAVRRRGSRLEPPHGYWATYEVSIKRDSHARQLRLVAKGAFDPDGWGSLRDRLEQRGSGEACDPINGIGYPRLFPESQLAFWFYPYDPVMPGLPAACDPATMAGVLLGDGAPAASAPRPSVERVRYLPEVGAILRYRFETSAGPITMYGKVQPGNRGLRTYRIVDGLWHAASNSDGLLHLPRPLGFDESLGLLIEEAIPGEPVSGDRLSVEFQNAGRAAAEALAVVHESGLDTDESITIEKEMERLDRVAEQFAYVHPHGHFLFKSLVAHLRDRIRTTQEEELVPTHGDLKYDQFIHHEGTYTLIDFDYFALAEESYDLGKFCAYGVPSTPKGWEDSVAAEETRQRFINRYMKLRPYARLDRLGIYEAITLALRAMTFMWAQTPGWEGMSETFLVMAHERLYSRLPE